MSTSLQRHRLVESLVSTLESLDYINAVWQGGAAAFGRVDAWSDIDLVIDVSDERADDVWEPIERAIKSISSIELCYRNPQPPLGLHAQRFYRLREAGPFLLLDIGVFKASTPNKLIDPVTHGNALVHFDRTGTTRIRAPDAAARDAELRARVESLRVTFPLFQSLVLKELHRGNDIEALAFYHTFTLRPLIELLRIHHCPGRYQFHTRYVHYDLPCEIVERLRSMFFVRDAKEMGSRRAEAEVWFNELLRQAQA